MLMSHSFNGVPTASILFFIAASKGDRITQPLSDLKPLCEVTNCLIKTLVENTELSTFLFPSIG